MAAAGAFEGPDWDEYYSKVDAATADGKVSKRIWLEDDSYRSTPFYETFVRRAQVSAGLPPEYDRSEHAQILHKFAETMRRLLLLPFTKAICDYVLESTELGDLEDLCGTLVPFILEASYITDFAEARDALRVTYAVTEAALAPGSAEDLLKTDSTPYLHRPLPADKPKRRLYRVDGTLYVPVTTYRPRLYAAMAKALLGPVALTVSGRRVLAIPALSEPLPMQVLEEMSVPLNAAIKAVTLFSESQLPWQLFPVPDLYEWYDATTIELETAEGTVDGPFALVDKGTRTFTQQGHEVMCKSVCARAAQLYLRLMRPRNFVEFTA